MTKPECGNLPNCRACGKCNEILPESKPEKNCGNCANRDCIGSSNGGIFCHSHRPLYPKPAEPQSWEQRFDKQHPDGLLDAFPDCYPGGDTYRPCTDEVKDFIRDEIERVREEEKQAIVAFLRGHWLMTDGLAPMAGDIEQNRHRREKRDRRGEGGK